MIKPYLRKPEEIKLPLVRIEGSKFQPSASWQEENWKTLLEGTEGKPFTNKNTRELQRFLLGNATYVELDAKGRFLLQQFLREFAYIKEEVIFAGIERFVEIWDKEQWDKHQENLSKNISNIAERLSDLNE